MMLDEISLHRITDVKINIPNYDHNWIELTVTNTRDRKFELTMFLSEGEKETTIYEFLHELRDSTETAIKELISVQQPQSED